MEAELKIEPAGRYGIVPLGTYLIDAARRMGVRIDLAQKDEKYDPDVVKITKGSDLLSEPTKIELEHLSPEQRKKGERLASQAKIEKTGEICIMTTVKPKPEVPPFEQFKKEFADLPLEEKIRKLLDLESIALSDTFSFVINLPYYIGEKLRDGVAEFGFKMEQAEREAKRPADHQTGESVAAQPEKKPRKPRATAAKTASSPKKAAVAKKVVAPKKTTRKRTTKPKGNNETSA